MNDALLIKRKFRWFAKLFKDAKQVNEEEPVRVSRRPPLTIHATADKSWYGGGEMMLTFPRTGIPWDCDEIVLSVMGSDDKIFEEWELCGVKRIPLNLFTSHVAEIPNYEDNEDEETLRFTFEHMRYRGPDGKWDNGSTLSV